MSELLSPYDAKPGVRAPFGEGYVGDVFANLKTRCSDGFNLPPLGKCSAKFGLRDAARAGTGGLRVAETEQQ